MTSRVPVKPVLPAFRVIKVVQLPIPVRAVKAELLLASKVCKAVHPVTFNAVRALEEQTKVTNAANVLTSKAVNPVL